MSSIYLLYDWEGKGPAGQEISATYDTGDATWHVGTPGRRVVGKGDTLEDAIWSYVLQCDEELGQ